MATKPANRFFAPTETGPWWWLRQCLFTLLAVFFTGFGVFQLVAAYRLDNPFAFIMAFFGASLMILISLVMTLGFLVRMRRVLRGDREADSPDTPD